MSKNQVIENVKEIAKNFNMGFITESEKNLQILENLKAATSDNDHLLNMYVEYEKAVKLCAEVNLFVDGVIATTTIL